MPLLLQLLLLHVYGREDFGRRLHFLHDGRFDLLPCGAKLRRLLQHLLRERLRLLRDDGQHAGLLRALRNDGQQKEISGRSSPAAPTPTVNGGRVLFLESGAVRELPI